MRVQDSQFDSRYYNLRVAHLHSEPNDGEQDLSRALHDARGQGVAVLFLRLSEPDLLRPIVERRGYSPIDVLVTSQLGRERPKFSTSPEVTITHHDLVEAPEEVAAIEAITAATMRISHLHADPRLPVDGTRSLYAAWARNDVTGRAQRSIVARIGDEVVGYIAVLTKRDHAIIDLIAVADRFQGNGIGSSLLASFIQWVDAVGLSASIGTQAENPALKLYARCGFVPVHRQFSYHLWLAEPP